MKRAAQTLGVTCNNFDLVLENAEQVNEFLDTCSEASRANKVRLKSEFLWACKDGKLSSRHFRVLCALLSKIGNKRYAKCGWREIQARAAGRCGKIDMVNPPAKELLLTRDQISRTIQQLETWNFFARFPYGSKRGTAGETWFSFSMPHAELVKTVLSKKKNAAEKLSKLRVVEALRVAENQRSTGTSPRAYPRTSPRTINQNVFNENNFNPNENNDARVRAGVSVSGYLINGIFKTTEQANALLVNNPDKADAILDNAVRAELHADGSVTTAFSNQGTITRQTLR